MLAVLAEDPSIVLCTHIMIGSQPFRPPVPRNWILLVFRSTEHVHGAHTYNEGKSFMYIKY